MHVPFVRVHSEDSRTVADERPQTVPAAENSNRLQFFPSGVLRVDLLGSVGRRVGKRRLQSEMPTRRLLDFARCNESKSIHTVPTHEFTTNNRDMPH